MGQLYHQMVTTRDLWNINIHSYILFIYSNSSLEWNKSAVLLFVATACVCLVSDLQRQQLITQPAPELDLVPPDIPCLSWKVYIREPLM